MAIFSFSVRPISRRAKGATGSAAGGEVGQSVLAAAAYRSASNLTDPRTGEVYRYKDRRGVEGAWVVENWHGSRQELWAATELIETRANARLAVELLLAVPAVLSFVTRKTLVTEFVNKLVDCYGVGVDVALHAPSEKGDQRNHHAHILLGCRAIVNGALAQRVVPFNGSAEVEKWRAVWAGDLNAALDAAGYGELVDHRSYRRQGSPLRPTAHMGRHATHLERDDVATAIGDLNRAIQARNAAVLAANAETRHLDALIAHAERQERSARVMQNVRAALGLGQDSDGPASAVGVPRPIELWTLIARAERQERSTEVMQNARAALGLGQDSGRPASVVGVPRPIEPWTSDGGISIPARILSGEPQRGLEKGTSERLTNWPISFVRQPRVEPPQLRRTASADQILIEEAAYARELRRQQRSVHDVRELLGHAATGHRHPSHTGRFVARADELNSPGAVSLASPVASLRHQVERLGPHLVDTTGTIGRSADWKTVHVRFIDVAPYVAKLSRDAEAAFLRLLRAARRASNAAYKAGDPKKWAKGQRTPPLWATPDQQGGGRQAAPAGPLSQSRSASQDPAQPPVRAAGVLLQAGNAPREGVSSSTKVVRQPNGGSEKYQTPPPTRTVTSARELAAVRAAWAHGWGNVTDIAEIRLNDTQLTGTEPIFDLLQWLETAGTRFTEESREHLRRIRMPFADLANVAAALSLEKQTEFFRVVSAAAAASRKAVAVRAAGTDGRVRAIEQEPSPAQLPEARQADDRRAGFKVDQPVATSAPVRPVVTRPVREPQVMGTLAATAALLAVGVLWTTNDGTKAWFVASEQTWHGTGRLDDSLDNLGPALQEIGVRPMRQTRFDSSAHEFLVQTADIAAALAKMTRAVFDEWIVRLTKATAASRENAKALKRRQQQRQHGRGRDDGMGM